LGDPTGVFKPVGLPFRAHGRGRVRSARRRDPARLSAPSALTRTAPPDERLLFRWVRRGLAHPPEERAFRRCLLMALKDARRPRGARTVVLFGALWALGCQTRPQVFSIADAGTELDDGGAAPPDAPP